MTLHHRDIPLGLSFDDVLIQPSYSRITSREDVTVEQSGVLSNRTFRIPIMSANMDTITGYDMAIGMAERGGLGIIHRYMTLEESDAIAKLWFSNEPYPLALSVGCLKKDKARIDLLIDKYGKNDLILCVDIAHGHSKNMEDTLEYIRKDKNFTGSVIAGNVCTPQGTKSLLYWGADIVKIGVDPGSVCTTRMKTGCGYPQFSAIIKCSRVGPVIADGGIRTSGDAAKALAAGAEFVMIGGMLAGTDWTPNWDRGFEEIEFRGMASPEARSNFSGATKNAEGVSCLVKVQPSGSTADVLVYLEEGVRSAMSYTGSNTLDDFRTQTMFVQATNATQVENTPHYGDYTNVK